MKIFYNPHNPNLSRCLIIACVYAMIHTMDEMMNNWRDSIKKKNKLHFLLAYSYSIYLAFFLVGMIADFIFHVRILPFYTTFIGIGFIVWATILVLWAQYASSLLEAKKKKGIPLEPEDFHRGPYHFTRGPTHVGLSMLLFGFGFLLNSIIIVIITGIPFLITHFIHLRKMEEILEGKYGELYTFYKNKVKKIL